MVRNKVSTTLLFIGLGVWVVAIFAMPMSHTVYMLLSAAAFGVFCSAIVVGLFYRKLFPPATEA